METIDKINYGFFALALVALGVASWLFAAGHVLAAWAMFRAVFFALVLFLVFLICSIAFKK